MIGENHLNDHRHGLFFHPLKELYDFMEPGQLLDERDLPAGVRDEWRAARPDRWSLRPESGSHGGELIRE